MAFHIIYRTQDRVHYYEREVCPYQAVQRARQIESQGGEFVRIRAQMQGSDLTPDQFTARYDWDTDNRASPNASPLHSGAISHPNTR